jgi:hypothetical protein
MIHDAFQLLNYFFKGVFFFERFFQRFLILLDHECALPAALFSFGLIY